MHAKIPVSCCLLLYFILATAPLLHAAADDPTPDSARNAPTRMMAQSESAVDEDPFADDPFEGGDDDSAFSGSQFADPIQAFNRPMFTFNDKLYYYFLKPTAKGLAFILPKRSRICLKNCFYNLSMPVRAVNCLFQLKGPELGVELWRFIINSTAGIGGLFDPAGSFFYLPTYKEDTGQTFGVYGAGPGFYLTLPMFGPSSERDAIGMVFDIALDPLTYVPVPGLRLIVEPIIKTSLKPEEYDKLKAASLDPYSAIRDGYLQHREAEIKR